MSLILSPVHSRHPTGYTEGETMFPENTVITDGTTMATVKYSSEAFVVAETASGEIVLNASDLSSWSDATANAAVALDGFTILHPHVVYRLDGTRVDGYADRNRAIRRNRRRFPSGFALVDCTTAAVEIIRA